MPIGRALMKNILVAEPFAQIADTFVHCDFGYHNRQSAIANWKSEIL
jgi:hypothetical protein